MSHNSISGDPQLYLRRQTDHLGRHALEQTPQALVGWTPTIVGIGPRALIYRLMDASRGGLYRSPRDGRRWRLGWRARGGRGDKLA